MIVLIFAKHLVDCDKKPIFAKEIGSESVVHYLGR